MIEKIIELLPSEDLKVQIKETNHRFEEKELLQIIYDYAPTFDKKQELLYQFANISSVDISAQAQAYAKYDQDVFENFTKESGGFVYELHIKENPNCEKVSYICSSYEAALACIDRYYEEYADYGFKETNKTRYQIVKRKIFSENQGLEKDINAELVLGENKTVLKIWSYDDINCNSETLCSDCEEICPSRVININYPIFAQNHDIIKYLDDEGQTRLAVNIWDSKWGKTASHYFVIPLDADIFRSLDYDDYSFYHNHISLPLATIGKPEELDAATRRDYCDFIKFLNNKND